jgi:hypothetical protein
LDCDVPWCQQVAQANPTKKLGPDTIRNCIHYLRAVLRQIHVHSERPLAKGSIHHLNDGLHDSGHIGLRRHNRRETFQDVVGKALWGPALRIRQRAPYLGTIIVVSMFHI